MSDDVRKVVNVCWRDSDHQVPEGTERTFFQSVRVEKLSPEQAVEAAWQAWEERNRKLIAT